MWRMRPREHKFVAKTLKHPFYVIYIDPFIPNGL